MLKIKFRNWRIPALVGLLLFNLTAFGLDVPPLKRHVTDLAGILTPSELNRLEENLIAFENETSNQIAVLIINSLEGEPIEQYSIRVADQWKLGTADRDNGVLLLIAVQDRQMRIEVGYGLEGVLTDLISSQIIRNVYSTRIHKGNFTRNRSRLNGQL